MNLVERVKGILLTPKKEWAVIDGESATVGSLYTQYILPLAAIPAVAGFIGTSLIGIGFFGGSIRVPIGTGLTAMVVRYVGALLGVYILALITDALAPNFGGQKSQIQALKVAAYSSTAAWVAGIFMLVPGLRVLGLLGLYSLYLLYLGLPVLMKAPEDRSMGYTIVIIVVGAVLYLVIGTIANRMLGYGWMY